MKQLPCTPHDVRAWAPSKDFASIIEKQSHLRPFILTTERPNSSGADFESYVKFTCTPDPNPFLEQRITFQHNLRYHSRSD